MARTKKVNLVEDDVVSKSLDSDSERACSCSLEPIGLLPFIPQVEEETLSEKIKRVGATAQDAGKSFENLVELLELKDANSVKVDLTIEQRKVDWINEISPEYFYPNKEKILALSNGEEILRTIVEKEKTMDEWGLRNEHKLILLAGFKEVAKKRGFHCVKYHNLSVDTECASVVCEIHWKDCPESEGAIYSAIGTANLDSTESFTKNYLGEMAENRAFVRCVRSFLDIPVYGKDEIGPSIKKDAKKSQYLEQAEEILVEKNWKEDRAVNWINTKYGIDAISLSDENIKVFHLLDLIGVMKKTDN